MKPSDKSWYVYLLRCADSTLYAGVTTDLERRVQEHNGEFKNKGAKYTKARRPVELVYSESCAGRSEAGKREYEIRTLPRSQKLQLIDK